MLPPRPGSPSPRQVLLIGTPNSSHVWMRPAAADRTTRVRRSSGSPGRVPSHHDIVLLNIRDPTRRSSKGFTPGLRPCAERNHTGACCPLPHPSSRCTAPCPLPQKRCNYRSTQLFRSPEGVSVLLKRVVGWDAGGKSQGMNRRRPHDVSEGLQNLGCLVTISGAVRTPPPYPIW